MYPYKDLEELVSFNAIFMHKQFIAVMNVLSTFLFRFNKANGLSKDEDKAFFDLAMDGYVISDDYGLMGSDATMSVNVKLMLHNPNEKWQRDLELKLKQSECVYAAPFPMTELITDIMEIGLSNNVPIAITTFSE